MSRTVNHSIVDLTQDESCSNWFLQSEQFVNFIKNAVIFPLFWQICNPFSKRLMIQNRRRMQTKADTTRNITRCPKFSEADEQTV